MTGYGEQHRGGDLGTQWIHSDQKWANLQGENMDLGAGQGRQGGANGHGTRRQKQA